MVWGSRRSSVPAPADGDADAAAHGDADAARAHEDAAAAAGGSGDVFVMDATAGAAGLGDNPVDGAAAAAQLGLEDGEEAYQLPPPWVRYGITGLNIFTACVAMATAKQMMTPSNFARPPGAAGAAAAAAAPSAGAATAAAAAAAELPAWMRQRYGSGGSSWMPGRNIALRIARDTGVLCGASAAWYGVQGALAYARGGADDAINTAAAGATSAAFLGWRLFGDAAGGLLASPRAAARVGIWAAVGAWMGRAAWEDRQRVRGLLLKRQQELEQKHLHVPADRVRQNLDRELLIRLLRKEEKVQAARIQQHMESRGAVAPARGAAAAAAGAAAGTQGAAAAAPGAQDGGEDVAWRQLIESPPWLVIDEADADK
ncbi:MAG: hypothetical protein J3K34DRAFT_244282 [Monoraphidium minutum]|nr:MAG: hypothetical protein J3K34DRAFT_244282 [Monoraphidium minutum]